MTTISGTLWIGTVSEVTRTFILVDVDGTTATWKQLISPADADMLQSVFAAHRPVAGEDWVRRQRRCLPTRLRML